MSDSKARHNPSVVATSKYARSAAPQNDRRRELDSLTQDADAIARAKQEFAQISRQQIGRAAPVQLDDVEARQRKPHYTVAAPEPLPEAPDDAAHDRPSPKMDRKAAQAQPVQRIEQISMPATPEAAPKPKATPARAGEQRGARSSPSREMFTHVEHTPVLAVAPRPRNVGESWSARAQQFDAPYAEHWPLEQQIRSSRGL
ncbi:MAG TPA: hypothetical protein VFU22_01260, partial [Roseiflexaceae bacterium]|nr:hypothetical protein [Roseiflexaceae bacterium]